MFEKKSIDELSTEERLVGAHLIYEAFYPFYTLISLDQYSCAQLISGYMGLEDTDLEHIHFFFRAGKLAGLYAGYDGAEYAARQQMSVKYLMENLERDILGTFLGNLRVFGQGFGSMPDSNPYYLSRLSVHPDQRGTDCAKNILDDYFAQRSAQDYCLHVSSDNIRAIRFYEKHGFTLNETDKNYPVMLRPPNKS